MPNWTEEQQEVIRARGSNLLVSAAAGSGKTAVLVERILSMLLDEAHPTDIDRLLMVTFTNAAAGEMKDRIRAALEKKAEELPEEGPLQEHLQRQISLLPGAQITTIHSFCQYVIRNYFHTIGIDPGLRVADEGEQKLMQKDVLEALLEESYAAGEKDFLWMAECFAPGRGDEALGDLVLLLYRFSRGFPFPEKWLLNCAGACLPSDEGLDGMPFVKRLMQLTGDILLEVLEQIREARRIAACADGPYLYEEALYADEELVENLLAADTYSRRSEAFSQIAWARLSSKKDERIRESLRAQVKDMRDAYKKTVGDLKEEFFYAPPRLIGEQMKGSAPALAAITALTCRFAKRYAEQKRKKSLMDFDDLEHFALQILVEEQKNGHLSPTQAARELADCYEEILIDEYQDSNLVQEIILNSVSRGANIVMVGDVKQSIYRFRLARPELFMEKFDAYQREDHPGRRIDLHKNFRSRAEVLSGINMLFEQLMERSLGGIDYDKDAALYPGAVFEAGDDPQFRSTEVLILDTKTPEGAQAPDETDREMEARAVAERIRRMIARKEKVWDKEKNAYRPIEYRDIVILMRTIQGWAEVFAKVLGDLGIPVYTGSRTGYFSAPEVQTVLSLLRVIDNPRQDIPLTAVLHSPICALSGARLAAIRSAHPEVPFYEACMQEEALQPFFAMLAEFRDMASYLPIHELLWHILKRTGYGAYAAAMPGGAQRKANLDMLVQKAVAYESGSYHGLYHFVRYIENLHKYDIDFGEAQMEEQNEAVRILSIHKSKGLEFPVVFVCGMGKQINQMDVRGALIAHADLGIGCDYIDPVRRTSSPTLLKRLIRRSTLYESLGEELRVLYVAMTRAKEKLILSGTVSDLPAKLQKWAAVCRRRETVLPFTWRAGARSGWDWVLPALMRSRCFEELLPQDMQPDVRHPLYARENFCQILCLSTNDLVSAEKERQETLFLSEEELLSLPPQAVFDEEEARKLKEHLSFRYAYQKEGEVPSKVSVSELKRHSHEMDGEGSLQLYEEPSPVPLIPRFLAGEQEASGAARGTVYHRFMECLDFARLAGEETSREQKTAFLSEEMARAVRQGFLTEEEAALIDKRKILAFLEHKIAGRMARAAAAGALFRERQFVLESGGGQIDPNWDENSRVIIQGIIDAYFIEDGQIVLLDYKTDFVKLQEASSLYDKYAVQLEYYETALKRLTHLPVKEKLIYSFCLDRTLAGDV